MTKDEIKQALKVRGWTYQKLAEFLRVSPASLRVILSENGKLTDQLKAHIELLLNNTKEQLIMFKVTYPDALCQSWLPGWDELTPEQRQKGIDSVLMEAARLAADDAERKLTGAEIEQLKDFCSTLRGPAREFDGDEEDLEAAEDE